MADHTIRGVGIIILGGQPMKESVVFYKSFYDAIKTIPQEYQLELYNAIFMYAFDEVEPSGLSPVANVIFTLAKPNIDSAQKRYSASVENGKKGGRPPKKNPDETKEKPNNNPSKTHRKPKIKPTDNLNDNVDENDDLDVYANGNEYANEISIYQQVLAIAKEECLEIHKRHSDKVDVGFNRSVLDNAVRLSCVAVEKYTYQQLRELFRKASKMYCSQKKYKGCDLVWLLSHLQEIEDEQLDGTSANRDYVAGSSGYTLYACDIGEVKL